MPEYPINIKTRETAVTAATTNNLASANKGATLTNAEVDQKKSIDEISARYYVAHNTDGSIKTAYLQGDIHYVEDVSTTANQLQINSAGVITSLAAGITLFVKVNTLNTGASTIQITNTATNPDTVLGGGAKSILKNKDVALIGGELKEDEIVIMNYDGSNWQVVGESAGILDNQTVGSLITFDSTGKPVVVAPGTKGQVLTAAENAPPTFANFTSGQELDLGTILTDTWKRKAHNLGAVPRKLSMYFECIGAGKDNASANHGYSVGDRVYFGSQDQGGSNIAGGPALWADNVYAGVSIRSGGHFEFPHKWGLTHSQGQDPTAPNSSTHAGSITLGDGDGTGKSNYDVLDQDFKVVLVAEL